MQPIHNRRSHSGPHPRRSRPLAGPVPIRPGRGEGGPAGCAEGGAGSEHDAQGEKGRGGEGRGGGEARPRARARYSPLIIFHSPPPFLKICDTVAELAASTAETSPWPELLPFVFQCAQAGQSSAAGAGAAAPPTPPADARLAEAGLRIFAALASPYAGTLRLYLGTLHATLASCLASPSPDIAASAVSAATAFISAVHTSAERDAFQSLVPPMLAALGAALNSGDEASAQESIESLMEVAEEHPRFLRRQLAETVGAMLQIAEAPGLEPPTRQLAAEFVLTLCEAREKAPGMMRKLPSFVGRLFACLLTFLLDVEDDPAWHAADSEATAHDGEGELFEFGQEGLDRLALALGGGTVTPLASEALPALMADGADWTKRHAALVCLAQVAEGCAKAMATQTGPLVDFCIAGLADPHPRVRWAACQALGQMCTDLGPGLQREQGGRALPALLGAMQGTAAPRVQAHAAAALVNFTEACDVPTLAPHLDGLVSTLLALLQGGGGGAASVPRLVQEGALTALASVADAAKAQFGRYYSQVMPPLRSALATPPPPPGAGPRPHGASNPLLLRAKALECASLVGMAVGPDTFRADAHTIMGLLAGWAAAGPASADDPTPSYALQAGARICKCLGPEFLPYLDAVMPPLLAAAGAAPDVSITDAGGGDSSGKPGVGAPTLAEDDEDVETIYVGDRKICIRTSALEDKATACHMICCYADELKAGFFPYVERVTGVMVPLLKFYFHEGVRQAAAAAMPELLRSAVLAAEGGAPGADAAYVARMVQFIWPPLLEALAKEPELEVLASALEAVQEVVELAAPVPGALSPADGLAALARVQAVLAASEERRLERAARRASEDFDAEEAEALEVENEEEEELLDAAAGVVGAILKAHGDGAAAGVDALMPGLAPLLAPGSDGVAASGASPGERRIAVCIIDDVLEHCPSGAAKYAPQAAPVLVAATGDAAGGGALRQCAAYGLGVLAEARPALAGPFLAAAAEALLACAAAQEDGDEDVPAARDNAVSALGKVLECGGPGGPGAAAALSPTALDAVAAAFVGGLPLRADLVEARTSHARLVRCVDASDARILGAGNARLPAVVAALAGIAARGPGGGTDAATLARATALLAQMQAALPAGVMAAATARLGAAEVAALQAALAAAAGAA